MVEKELSDLQRDLVKEDAFKDVVHNQYCMEDELSSLVKVYGEQLEILVKFRIEFETSLRSMLAFPNDKSNIETNIKSKDALIKRRILVDTIRSQIVELVKWREAHKKLEVSV